MACLYATGIARPDDRSDGLYVWPNYFLHWKTFAMTLGVKHNDIIENRNDGALEAKNRVLKNSAMHFNNIYIKLFYLNIANN